MNTVGIIVIVIDIIIIIVITDLETSSFACTEYDRFDVTSQTSESNARPLNAPLKNGGRSLSVSKENQQTVAARRWNSLIREAPGSAQVGFAVTFRGSVLSRSRDWSLSTVSNSSSAMFTAGSQPPGSRCAPWRNREETGRNTKVPLGPDDK